MGLRELVDDILASAEKEAREIRRNAKKQADEIIKNTEKEISKLREEWEAENERIIEDIRRKRLASAKLEASKIVMKAKKEIMDDLMKSLLEKLANLDKKEKEKLISTLVKLAKQELQVATVYCNNDEKKLISKHFKNAKMKRLDCAGGFIAENKDGSMSVDMRYESLLEKVRREIIGEVGRKIFAS